MQKITEYRTPEGFFDADIDITKEEWLSIISNPDIIDNAYIDVLVKFLREPGHKSTCKALGKKYACSFNYFNAAVTNFGRHVKKKLNRFFVENTNGMESFWNIPMIGRNTKGGFEWTLRKELTDALQDFLINDLVARYKEYVMSPASKFSEEKYKWVLLTETKGKDVKGILTAITRSGMNIVDMPRSGFAIKHLLQENPAETESAFNELLNSERSFGENYSSFVDIIKPVAESKYSFAFPDERSAAAFLTCARPGTYTFYMDKIYQEYCHYLGEETKPAGSKYIHYLKLVSKLSQVANNDKELRYFLMEETKGLTWSDLLVGQDVLWEMQTVMIVENRGLGFAWAAFYEEFASKLAQFSEQQSIVLQKLKDAFSSSEQIIPRLSNDGKLDVIDPFTVYAMFNRTEGFDKRSELATQLKAQFEVIADAPLRFDGIPVLHAQNAAFYSFESEQKRTHISNLWRVFLSALDYANKFTRESREKFVTAFNIVREQPRIKWMFTSALFWIRPYSYISLDSNNRDLLLSGKVLSEASTTEVADILGKMKTIPDGEGYLRICDIVKNEIEAGKCPYTNFLELSYAAWIEGKGADDDNDDEINEETSSDSHMNHWFIVANPDIWSVSDKPVGAEEFYTFYNEKGNPRKILKNFQEAVAGDKVVFYEATPKKQAVCLGEITMQNGKELHFRKTADLDTPIDFSVLANTPELAGMEFMANKNGSVFRLTLEEYTLVSGENFSDRFLTV